MYIVEAGKRGSRRKKRMLIKLTIKRVSAYFLSVHASPSSISSFVDPSSS
jgi:hypothetical protein